MGQKVHPTGIRLGIVKKHTSVWFAEGQEYADNLLVDLQVREFVKKRLASASVSRVDIERPAQTAKITIYTARPGIVIGKKGEDVERLRGVLTKKMVKSMAKNPIIFACANPDPEIKPEIIEEVRSDAIIATGRSDYPNQVNNLIGFPYIFRGALDVRAKEINEEMKIAAAKAIALLAREDVPDEVVSAYGGDRPKYGKNYIIPKSGLNFLKEDVKKVEPPTKVKFQPIPKKNRANQKFNVSIPVTKNNTLINRQPAPIRIIFFVPKYEINEPVKKDGANIATTCH